MDLTDLNSILTFIPCKWRENYQLWARQCCGLLYEYLLPTSALNPSLTVEQF